MRRLRSRRPSVRLELVTQHAVEVPAELGERHASLTHPEMRGAYSRASVVALALKPNLHLSGLSVLLEAMACSRPVVITDSPGLQEYVTDGESGIVVQPGDPDALADRCRRIAGRSGSRPRNRRRRKGGNPERFTTDKQAERIAGILASVG